MLSGSPAVLTALSDVLRNRTMRSNLDMLNAVPVVRTHALNVSVFVELITSKYALRASRSILARL